MTQRNTLRSFRSSSFELRTFLATGFTAAALLGGTLSVSAQDAAPAPDAATTQPAADSAPKNDISLSNQKQPKERKAKEDKVVESKATKAETKKIKKDDSLAKLDPKLPDKALYDKAEDAIKHGRFDVGRLELQALLNTYPDSQYMMRSKLAVADSWYKEGGTAALTQAEQEYKDFITFFPNAPEAAEAQMRVGDIYFREMDKPDRDYTALTHAEEEYRLMLQQFPDSTLVPQAQQRLREVQEVLASRETNIGKYYAERQPPNYSGAIARYQTVADTYPLYSQMDDVLIGLGDAYDAEAKLMRAYRVAPNAPEAYKAQLEAGRSRMIKIDEDAAAAAYNKVVLEHAAAPHVEDAKDRLTAMGMPIPTPTPEQLAASTALENSRGQYTLSKRAMGFLLHQADTVPAATIGAPPLEDAAPVSAATVARKAISDFNSAMNPNMAQPAPSGPAQQPASTTSAPETPATAQPSAATTLSLQDVPSAQAGDTSSPAITNVPQSSPSTAPGGTGVGIEIVRPQAGQAPVSAPATPPAFPGTAPAAASSDSPQSPSYNGGIKPLVSGETPMAPIEKAAPAPDVINEAAGTKQPAAQAPPPTGKKAPKPAFDKSEESSSKHKKKKGIAKVNPF